MTTGDDGTGRDARLDALIRAAAERPTDAAALTGAVLARLRAERRAAAAAAPTRSWVPALAVAAGVAVLLATPLLIAGLPGPAPDAVAERLLGLALGVPGAFDLPLDGGRG